MKKFMKSLAFVAVAAMGFTACENSFDSQNEVEKVAYEIAVQADDTRSLFGDKEDGSYPTLWSGEEVVKVTLNAGDVQDATLTTSNGGADAKIKVELAADAEGTLHVLTPYNTGDYATGGFSGINTQYSDYYVTIPVEQTPCANSVDESAHLLFGECEVSGAMSVTMKHVAAYGKMTIKNFTPAIKSIELTSPVNFVGSGCYYYYAGEKVGQLTNAKSTTLTLNATNVENNVFWFTCAPIGTLSANMTVVITDSEDNTYTKPLVAAGKLAFEQGKVSNFSVDMTGIEKDVVEEVEGLAEGDYVVLKAKKSGTGYFAMDIEKYGDRQVAVDFEWDGESAPVLADEGCIWTLSKSGTGYNLQQGGKYVAFVKNGVSLTETATNLSFTANDNGSYIVKDEDTTSADANTRRLTVNEGYGFGFYATATGTWEIFMVPAQKDTTPKLEVVAQPEEVAAAGANVTVALTVANLTEDITVTPSESWITNATVSGSNLTFTVAANETEETREATITLTSGDLTATVEVSQAAKGATGGEEIVTANFEPGKISSACTKTDDKSNNWVITTDATYFGTTNGYIQVGSNKSAVSHLTFTTTIENVQTVTVYAAAKADTNATIKVYIGETLIGTSPVLSNTISSGGTKFEVENSENVSGALKVVVSRPTSATGALYFKSANVTYTK